MKHSLFSGLISILVLTVVLFGATFWLIGCFYESNDDIILTFLLSGFSGMEPITDLSLYLHGFGTLISTLYQILPGWPWYGLGLYSLLFGVSLLAFRFIYYSLNGKVSQRFIYFTIILFYLANWYEHVFWFNYSRLAILLAGVAGLNAWLDGKQNSSGFRKRMWSYGGLFFLALCIRPSFACLGIGLILPLFLISSPLSLPALKRTTLLLLPFLLAGCLFSGWLMLKSNPAQKEYQRLDVLKSQILDYNWCCPPTVASSKKLLYTGVQNWFLADLNIRVFLQQQRPDWNYFVEKSLVPKLRLLLQELFFNHFLALCILLAHFVWLYKSKITDKIGSLGKYHLYFWAVLLIVGILFKIPPRVLTPAISLLLLVHLAMLPPDFRLVKVPLFLKICGVLLFSLQMYKIGHRSIWQQQRQKLSENSITEINSSYPEYVVATVGLENELRALSPLKNYTFRKQQLLFLTGWQTLDPHYPAYLQSLAGQDNLLPALKALNEQKKVVVVSNSFMVNFLEAYYKHFYKTTFRFTFIKPVKASYLSEGLSFYGVELIND